jgi:DNA polymerase-3 subunit gamma/tau
VDDEPLMLVARAAEGSMRDAESALDQVIAFAGTTITAEDVSTVIGLVGRDLLFDILQAVASEDAAAAFALTAQAVEAGHDLKLVCRELSRLVRDLLLVNVDPQRLSDPEVATESERERLQAVGRGFSREDLLRAFDLLARTEAEVRASAHPRYHFEIGLLRWMHLRKLVPIEDMIASLERSGASQPAPAAGGGRPSGASFGSGTGRISTPGRSPFGARTDGPRKPGGPQATVARIQGARAASAAAAVAAPPASDAAPLEQPGEVRDAFLTELKRTRGAFFGMVVSQAQTVECDGRRLVFTFGPQQDHLRAQIDARRADLEQLAQQVAGRRVPVVTMRGIAPSAGEDAPKIAAPVAAPPSDADLRTRALADENVQALLEIFPAEIKGVEEM